MKSIDVSLVIVNWNTRDIMLDCIESLHRTTHQVTYEIIIVDNASEDGSASAAREKYPEVIVIENRKNLGFAAANNIGIKKSRGSYVCLVNSDIIFLEKSLDSLFDFMEKNRSIGAAGPMCFGLDQKFQSHVRRFPNLMNGLSETFRLDRVFPNSKRFQGRLIRDISQSEVSFVDVLPMCYFMIRRKALKEVGLLDEQFFIYGEDRDWCKRLNNLQWKLAFYPGSTAIHIGGASSNAEPLRFNIEMIKSDFLYWSKHHSKLEFRIYVILKLLHQLVRMIMLLLFKIIKPNTKSDRMDYANRKKCLIWIWNNAFSLNN